MMSIMSFSRGSASPWRPALEATRAGARPANNPLHRTGERTGRAVFVPSALCSRLGCCGAVVASR
jgi:hypothetical protein